MPSNLITKRISRTDPRFGKRPEDRTVEELLEYGVINLDKPSGPTSHEVVSWIKKILNIKKAGHGGTLDPRVTGVLPVSLGESTKIIQAFSPPVKEYICLMRLHEKTNAAKIRAVFEEFKGEIYQKPPVKSAVKRQLRTKRISCLHILEIQERDVLFKVECEAGTYIRKLCHDLGEVIGCGAHMAELRRTRSGIFTEENLVTLHDVIDAYRFFKEEGKEILKEIIIPVENIIPHLPRVVVRDSAVDAICHGAELAVPGICKVDPEIRENDTIAILTLKNELVAVGRALMDARTILIHDSGIAARSVRVIMKPGTYPKMWRPRAVKTEEKTEDDANPGFSPGGKGHEEGHE